MADQPLAHWAGHLPAALPAESTRAGLVWALFNLGLLGISLVVLRSLLKRHGDSDPHDVFIRAAAVLLILSSGSIQVGQFSVLFVTCWILSLRSLAAGRYFWSAVFLAIPTAIKLYPLMMVAVPISLTRTWRMGLRQALLLLPCLIVTCVFVPTLMYGPRGLELNVCFWKNVVLSPTGQMAYMQTVRYSNQSLDTALLRYLSYDFEFHDLFVGVPHLWWEKVHVLEVANLARGLVFLATATSVWLWRRRAPRTFCQQDLVTMAALWSSTRYLLLPETKARYAVYAFLGFLPLIQAAANPRAQSTRMAGILRWTEVVACVVLILVLLPGSVQVYGVGFLGALLLWLENIRHTTRARSLWPISLP